MGDIATVNDVDLAVIEHEGQRVVTLGMVDQVHQRANGTARRTFNENRGRFIEGKHCFVRNSSEAKKLGIVAPNGITLLTERGYLMLVKSFNDELAWQVQDQLVDCYFKVQAATKAVVNGTIAREQRLQFKHHLQLAKMIGLEGNQAILAANTATTAMTSIDTLGLMGTTHLAAPANEMLLTPTAIGQQTGLGSAREINLRLCEMGLQMMGRDDKGRIYYEPTPAGKEAGAVMQDTGKRHGSGTPVRQLKWNSSVVDLLKEQEAA